MAYYALGFFGGEPAAERLRAGLDDPDRFARYNAAVALTRRGDRAAVGTLREMLSTSDLDKALTLPSKPEKEHKIESIELEALQALQVAVDRRHAELAEALRPQVEVLTHSGLVGVRNQALALLRARGGSGKSVPSAPGP
jgi:HEAT repeat protein